jgi:TonB family protein
MVKVVNKIFHEPFGLNHAAIISVAVHFVIISTQPFSFLKKPPALDNKYKEIKLEFINKSKVTPVLKEIIEVRNPVLKKINDPIVPKSIVYPFSNPIQRFSSQPLTIKQTVVSPVTRSSQITLPLIPTIQKYRSRNNIPKTISEHFNVPKKSKKSPEILARSKIYRGQKLKFSGNRKKNISEQLMPRNILDKVEDLEIVTSNFINTKRVIIQRVFNPRAINLDKPTLEVQENILSEEEMNKLWAGYTNAVRKMIAHAKIYPSEARDKGQQGKTDLSFKLGKDGELLKLFIQNSSGNNTLDNAARNAVKNAGPFPPIPKKLNKKYVLLELPVSFVLR